MKVMVPKVAEKAVADALLAADIDASVSTDRDSTTFSIDTSRHPSNEVVRALEGICADLLEETPQQMNTMPKM